MKKIKNKGGYRAGAGRKPGWGRYKEPTIPIRIPESLIPKINKMLDDFADRKQKDNHK